MITFQNVSKMYPNGTHALNHVNLNIDKGEFVFIVGSSGAGKSTFLKLIMCEERPSEGTIIIGDTVVTELKRRQIPYLRRMMGIVFQDFRLIGNMSVYENVAFAMHVVGASNKEIRRRVPYFLSLGGSAGQGPVQARGAFRRRAAARRTGARAREQPEAHHRGRAHRQRGPGALVRDRRSASARSTATAPRSSW